MGVTVLQTSLEEKTPEEIYCLYKKRWKLETFYSYIANDIKPIFCTTYSNINNVSNCLLN